MVDCFLCGSAFEFGPNLYKGRHIGQWGISVCQGCGGSPWGEVPPIYTTKIVEYLQANGIAFQRNPDGFVIWPR